MHPPRSCSPEFELLLCCARTRMEAETAERLRALLQHDIDWSFVTEKANQNQVVPLLYHSLKNADPGAIPDAVLAHLRYHSYAIAARNIFLTQELVKLLRCFQTQGIPAIPLKGPVLASSVYGSIALRQFGDLDILLHAYDYQFGAKALLASNGWRLIHDYGWESTWADEGGKVYVDLHKTITASNVPFRCNFYRLWERCMPISAAGVTLRAPSPPHLLIIQCLQVAKDVIGKRIQLAKICDVAEFIRSHHSMDWGLAFSEARKLGVLHIVYLGLLIASDVFGVALPKDAVVKMRSVPKLASLVAYVQECLFQDTDVPYSSSSERFDPSRFPFEIRERWRDRVNQGWLDWMLPTPYDYEFFRLPGHLHFFYYALRPIRLFQKYGKRAVQKIVNL